VGVVGFDLIGELDVVQLLSADDALLLFDG
jgi:hypothetical protein